MKKLKIFKETDIWINLLMKKGKKDKAYNIFEKVLKNFRYFSNSLINNKQLFFLLNLQKINLMLTLCRILFRFKIKKIARKKVYIPILLRKIRSYSETIRYLYKSALNKNTKILDGKIFLKQLVFFFSYKGVFFKLRKDLQKQVADNKSNCKYLKKKRPFNFLFKHGN